MKVIGIEQNSTKNKCFLLQNIAVVIADSLFENLLNFRLDKTAVRNIYGMNKKVEFLLK